MANQRTEYIMFTGNRVLINGATGTGKTTLSRRVADAIHSSALLQNPNIAPVQIVSIGRCGNEIHADTHLSIDDPDFAERLAGIDLKKSVLVIDDAFDEQAGLSRWIDLAEDAVGMVVSIHLGHFMRIPADQIEEFQVIPLFRTSGDVPFRVAIDAQVDRAERRLARLLRYGSRRTKVFIRKHAHWSAPLTLYNLKPRPVWNPMAKVTHIDLATRIANLMSSPHEEASFAKRASEMATVMQSVKCVGPEWEDQG